MMFNSNKKTSRKPLTSNSRAAASITTRIVTNKRWVHRDLLEVGMYVNELDKPWSETRFMFQGFVIDNFDTLKAVQDTCEYAYVQTEKVAMISSNSVYRLVGATR